jgi:ferritin-like metal-binding protein YciE
MNNPIPRYLEDAIAAEKSFESQLNGFASEACGVEVKNAFAAHAVETKHQYEMLTERLNQLGGEPSAIKSAMAHFFNMAPRAAQIGYSDEERTTQDLIMAYSVENAEVAMYQAMIAVAESIGDNSTATLAKRIQNQERDTAEKVWRLIPGVATHAFRRQLAEGKGAREIVIRYLEDVEAAEQNFEDALASFSKAGDQPHIQSLLSMMSEKAKTQHERLETRLRELGGSRSVAKSALAHMLAFTPVSAQMGHEPGEKNTQHLMIVYSAAAAEMGMYEALAVVAKEAGDAQTMELARELQSEEQEDYDLAWQNLTQSAKEAAELVMSKA